MQIKLTNRYSKLHSVYNDEYIKSLYNFIVDNNLVGVRPFWEPCLFSVINEAYYRGLKL